MKIGVYVCHCGKNISNVINVEEVAEYASKIPGVVIAKDYRYMCSDPGQEMMKADIAAHNLDRIVIAACSPSMHQTVFMGTASKSGMNPYRVERANIRENVSWVNSDHIKATEKAKILVAAAVTKVMFSEALSVKEVSVTPTALVIGGGISGIQSAIDIGDSGFKVCLVEREAELGGNMARLSKTFPVMENARDIIADKIELAENNPNIEILTSTEIVKVHGYIGNFEVELRNKSSAETKTIHVGAIILATGYSLFDAKEKPELGYGQYPNVITGMDFEALGGKIELNGKKPENVVFVQCVGSRDETVHADFCSRVCCMYTAKQALQAREYLPEARITICYIDVRAFGRGNEEFYERVQKNKIIYRRGLVSEISRLGEKVRVIAEDTLLGEIYEEEADLVVLATGMRPALEAKQTAKKFNVSTGADSFFLEAHPKLGPVETTTDGVFLAGCCVGPKDITDSVSQAHAAAIKACIPLFQKTVKREPLVAHIEAETCAGCKLCEPICEYGALVFDEKKRVMTVNEALCRGCGSCGSACPSASNQVKNSSKKQLFEMIDILV
ncbi:MAG: CoB--CoM heterodisulfide reductase iron-sulfur subunit A family protein [Leptospirales bacterium]|nr:CoB--CoM heterodisulfide reductase iron-sulfur subunit A family protein [Leptospirales bacterium]